MTQPTDQQIAPSIQPSCSQCREYSDGLCKLKARAGWEEQSRVKPTRSACHFADLLPF
ncbi:MAG: hypothetical protein KME18_25725 [Phormidium tanganyikae FI6-MK23]|nr:hypothetical protein [Phormidium tanganyikae FI6-MK23]